MATEWGWSMSETSEAVAIVHRGQAVIIFEDMTAAKRWYWMCGIILRGMDKLGQIEQGYDAVAEATKHLEVRNAGNSS